MFGLTGQEANIKSLEQTVVLKLEEISQLQEENAKLKMRVEELQHLDELVPPASEWVKRIKELEQFVEYLIEITDQAYVLNEDYVEIERLSKELGIGKTKGS